MNSYNIIKLVLLAEFILGDDSLPPSTDTYSRIVGGSLTSIENQPYQVALYDQRSLHCGGSIIDANWVLTAAHCCTGESKLRVKAGSTDICEGEFSSESDEIYIHPKYNTETFDNDACLLRLTKRLDLNGRTMNKIELANADDIVEPGEALRVTGWGTTTEGGKRSCKLLGVRVNVINKESCERAYERRLKTQICAGIETGGKDSCQGDSGGPLVNYRSPVKQIGLVSFGRGCARKDFPGIYTFIPTVRKWIRSVSGI